MLARLEPTELAPAAELLSAVNEWSAELDLAADTRETYRVGVLKFIEWHAGRGTPIDAAEVRAWRDAHDSASTANLRLTALRRFFDWLVDRGLIAGNPARAVRGKKRPGTTKAHKRDALTDDEVRALLAGCDDTPEGRRDRALLALMAYAGLRTVEIYRADLADLRARGNRQALWVQGKGHEEKDDYVILNASAESALRRWLAMRGDAPGPLFTSLSNRSKGARLGRAAIRRILWERFKAAGIVGDAKTAHSLRHSAITAAIRGGATPLQTRAFSRHRSLDMLMIYYHEASRDADPAELRIDYGEDEEQE